MKDDLKELKDWVTIHCLGSISDESYNFLIKKIERLEAKALNMHVVGVRSEQLGCKHIMSRTPKEHQEDKCRLCGKPYQV